MFLEYPDKKPVDDILSIKSPILTEDWNTDTNKLISGENLLVLKSLLDHHNMRGKIKLVYIDPPFATDRVFSMDSDYVGTMNTVIGAKIAYTDKLLGFEYIEFLRQRLILIKELMSPDASIYIHIDCKMGHYVKILMDEVFGIENFRNDITRIKCYPKNIKRKCYGNIKDMILFYTKSSDYTWNDSRVPYTEEDIKKLYKRKDKDDNRFTAVSIYGAGESKGDSGGEWQGRKPPKGMHWRPKPEVLDELDANGRILWTKNGVPRKIIYPDEVDGKKRQDIWDINDITLNPKYPTEKNQILLDTIISASSNEGDLVLDCFSGSGTTLKSASDLNRRWIGVEVSTMGLGVIKDKLNENDYELI